jgi:hypothetical protein
MSKVTTNIIIISIDSTRVGIHRTFVNVSRIENEGIKLR